MLPAGYEFVLKVLKEERLKTLNIPWALITHLWCPCADRNRSYEIMVCSFDPYATRYYSSTQQYIEKLKG